MQSWDHRHGEEEGINVKKKWDKLVYRELYWSVVICLVTMKIKSKSGNPVNNHKNSLLSRKKDLQIYVNNLNFKKGNTYLQRI